jgi:hypothetical protein
MAKIPPPTPSDVMPRIDTHIRPRWNPSIEYLVFSLKWADSNVRARPSQWKGTSLCA